MQRLRQFQIQLLIDGLPWHLSRWSAVAKDFCTKLQEMLRMFPQFFYIFFNTPLFNILCILIIYPIHIQMIPILPRALKHIKNKRSLTRSQGSLQCVGVIRGPGRQRHKLRDLAEVRGWNWGRRLRVHPSVEDHHNWWRMVDGWRLACCNHFNGFQNAWSYLIIIFWYLL